MNAVSNCQISTTINCALWLKLTVAVARRSRSQDISSASGKGAPSESLATNLSIRGS